ncbi:cell envelope biogenesis protein OmpA [Spirochaetia bacterium]|nr:cell envelope biogenesis protein OmpA [Spirochaetia bacterium]
MFRRYLLTAFIVIGLAANGLEAELPGLVTGADTAEDLYAPVLAGGGAFSTTLGGAPASAVNPAAGGEAQRIVFDAGYLMLPTFGGDTGGVGQAINLGALFPTKFAVFGGSVNFLYSPFDDFLPANDVNFKGNLNIAKELYPGLDIGLAFNFGFGSDWSASGDIGVRYNMGKLGKLENFTLAFVMKSMGKSVFPSAFTPLFGVSTDLIHLKSNGDTADPLRLSGAIDLGIPSLHNLTGKIGLNLVLAELITISSSWGFNGYENLWGPATLTPTLPTLGIGLNFALQSKGKRIMGGRLPSDGDITTTAVIKPLYNSIYALGAGVTWSVGVTDKKAPDIIVDYPETQYISPNHDGLADTLEFPVKILDQRYVNEWAFEIKDSAGEVVRTYRNKELRPETIGIKNIFIKLVQVKAAVEIPAALRWDGIFDSGDTAPDGVYTFTITAADDNDNTDTAGPYEVVVDNTPPTVAVTGMADSAKIFSPDGDGRLDTITIRQSGSREDRWDAGIYNAAGIKVKSFDQSTTEPLPLTWDGADDAGHIVVDGVYGYRISATDRALNTGNAALENIIVSTIQPTVSLLIGDAWFSPNGDGIKDTVALNIGVPVKEGIVQWQITVRNAAAAEFRTIKGAAGAPPARLEFDGKNDAGQVLEEGSYHTLLSVFYRNGYVSQAVSPAFTLDNTAPAATVRAGYNAFSPNNDGNQDEMIFNQTGSRELVWQGEIRRAVGPSAGGPAAGGPTAAGTASGGATVVRTIRMSGEPSATLRWEGLTDAGSLAPDGEYTYQLSAVDPAGNSGRSNTIRFTLSTADTPVLLSTDYRAFSPNGDRVRDTIALTPQLQVNTGIASWKVEVLNASGTPVRTFEGQNSMPAAIPWDGRIAAAGGMAPDGTYRARVEVRYAAGNQRTVESRPFTLDTTPPRAEIAAPYTIFSPNGDGVKDEIPINVRSEGNDTWEAAITDSKGTVIQSWTWTGAAPKITWDGKDSSGNSAPDGTYRVSLSSTDEAGNSLRKTIDRIDLDARIPRVFLTASATGIAPKAGGLSTGAQAIRLMTMLSIKDGIESWKLELKDESGAVAPVSAAAPATVLRTWPETPQATPPETITWNGLNAAGVLKEGKYTPTLTVVYLKGDVVTAQAAPVTVDSSGPVLSFRSEPEFFSPDNDGVDDELTMFLGAKDASPIASWSLEIREPEPPYLVFYRIEGRGAPAERTLWDGRSSKGERSSGTELVQSATNYPYTFTAEDVLGNASTLEGELGVDVLVIRDGDRLKIQIPSIVFRANRADFAGRDRDPAQGLTQAQIDNNNRVLRRIAQILNKFRDYQVQVEGHANRTSRNPPAGELEGDKTLSKQRADFTVSELVRLGVNKGRLSATGMGSDRPVVQFEDRDNWWKNRRVEFILIK